MTKELLEQYINLKAELAELQEELRNVGKGDRFINNDVINDYRTGYPIAQAVVGPDWDNLSKTVKKLTGKIDRVRVQKEEIEQFIDDIEDSQLRRIFRMRYMDGMTQRNIAKRMHMDRSRVSRKIDDYLKNAHKAQKTHV